MLIEATLADGTNQRIMKMEPVSRHLGDYCIYHPEDEAYCVFVTTYLNMNVISDFRARRYKEIDYCNYRKSPVDCFAGVFSCHASVDV